MLTSTQAPRPALGQVAKSSLGTLRDLLSGSVDSVPHRPEDLDLPVEQVELTAPNGSITVTVCSLGATVTSIRLGRTDQEVTFQEQDWVTNYKGYNGRSCGRLAGRTGKYTVRGLNGEGFDAKFDVTKETQILHGGEIGFSFRVWRLVNTFCSQKYAHAVFEVGSEHYDQGHPGSLKAEVHILAIDGPKPRFDVRYRARLDPSSPCEALINMTSHCYFNLGGDVDALQHELYLPHGSQYIPKHLAIDSAKVSGKFDFTKGSRPVEVPLDDCFVFDNRGFENEVAAVLLSRKSKLRMTVYTSCPGVVVYTAQHAQHKGICLEFQYPPNFANMGEMYRDGTTLRMPDSAVQFQASPDRKKARFTSSEATPLYNRLASFERKASVTSMATNPYPYDELTMHEFSFLDDA